MAQCFDAGYDLMALELRINERYKKTLTQYAIVAQEQFEIDKQARNIRRTIDSNTEYDCGRRGTPPLGACVLKLSDSNTCAGVTNGHPSVAERMKEVDV